MLKNIKIMIFSLVIFVVCASCVFLNYSTEEKIEEILKRDDYSYLPAEAQDYIRQVYEDTGEIILTEKNKEENTPYLNPQYISYLSLPKEKQQQVELIPNTYIVDFVSSGTSLDTDFPETYNLSNINGKSYVSPVKNQGNLGTCWAFATVENAESYLMVTNNEEYNVNSTQFSIRQLDYAASIDGIKNYNNPFGVSPLGQGGNFNFASRIMANGLSLVDNKKIPYNESLDKKSLHEIHNYNNSLYELNSTVELPAFAATIMFNDECFNSLDDECYDEQDEKYFDEYIKIIKNGVMNYGGIYLGAYDPTGQCGAVNSDGFYVLDPNQVCFPRGSTAPAETGHAMQIIGWDDNYEYSYCRKKEKHLSSSNGECSQGTLVQGTGAWLVQNSWGDTNPYVYVTYNSIKNYSLTFSYINSISAMEEKTWDNAYNFNSLKNSVGDNISKIFNRSFSGKERIEKIKFYSAVMNERYKVAVTINGNTYTVEEAYETDYPGLYTVDVSDKNIVVNSAEFKIEITGSKLYSIYNNSLSVFTKNIDSDQLIKSEENVDVNSNSFTIYSETNNIPSNSEIEYELYNGEEKIENALEIEDNYVAANNVNAQVSIVKKINPGEYTLVQKYGEATFSTNLSIGTIFEGKGTEERPFKIYDENDLKAISNSLDSYYELENDIELTEEWIPIGTKENPFTGALNGKNHKIINLQINDSTLEYVGLFGYVKDSLDHQVYIKNIYLENFNIKSSEYIGGLIGEINIENEEQNITLIDSVYIIGGTISGKYSGGLIGNIKSSITRSKIKINNIFSSANINGSISSALIRLDDSYYSNKGVQLTNIQNIGIVYDNSSIENTKSSTIIESTHPNNYTMSEFISTGYIKNNTQNFNVVSYANGLNLSNGYYLKQQNNHYDNQYSSDNVVGISSIIELKQDNNYNLWNNFDSYWKIETVNGIKRIPVLKGVDLEYTSINEIIELELGSTISLFDYVSPKNNIERLNVTNLNDNILQINKEYDNDIEVYYPQDIKITGQNAGKTKMHVISDYDGYENDITIVVKKNNPTITYHHNDFNYEQISDSNVNVKLDKNEFENEGYTFKEWNTKADGSGVSYEDGAIISELLGDIDLYAVWEAKNIKISFNANGGEGTMSDIFSVVGETVILPQYDFTKEGYTATSWNTKPDGTGTKYLYGGVINVTDNITLYVQWQPIKYYIKYTYIFKNISSLIKNAEFTYDQEKQLDSAYEDKEGYKFVYWGTEPDGTGTNYLPNQQVKNLTTEKWAYIYLYTIYQPITYKVSFNANGGAGTVEDETLTYDVNSNLTKNTFVREGYNFIGWNTKADGSGTSYSDEQEILNLSDTENHVIELYAQWELVKKYIVTFYANNGTSSYSQQESEEFSSLNLTKNNFIKQGYKFIGWNTKEDGSGVSYSDEQAVTLNNNLNLYAQWQPIKYKIKFYANGGEGFPKEQEVEYDEKIKLNKNTFTKSGYSFKEWNTELDGSEISYTDEQEILNLSDTENYVIELYAQWEESMDYVINNYSVDETNKYISKIMVNTEVNNFTSNIILGYGYGLDVDTTTINNKHVLYTGGKTKITKGLNIYKEYTNVVTGDVNGNGRIDIIDYIRVMKDIMNTEKLSGAYRLSADMNDNGQIDIIDYIRIMKIIMEEN